MSLQIPQTGFLQLLKGGYKHQQGLDDAVIRNTESVQELVVITRSSFGPNGCNKIILNHLEKLFVTNDAATIVKELDVIHPAAKVLIQASKQQESEAGDGTNLVLVITGELLKCAQHLFRMGLHISEVIDGYRVTIKRVQEILPDIVVDSVKNLHDADEVRRVVFSSISAKQYDHKEILTDLACKAIMITMPSNPANFDMDTIRVLRIMGGSIYDSGVIPGMLFPREAEGVIKFVKNPKVAIFTCPIDVSITETKGTVLITKVDEMLNFSNEEESRLEDISNGFKKIGVNVIVTSGTTGALALHFMDKYKIMVFRVQSKFDLRRLARVSGATALARLCIPSPEELGTFKEIYTKGIGGDICTVFDKGCERAKTATIYLRGGTQGFMEDIERGVDDAVSTVKCATRDQRLLPGAGAAEIELSIRLRKIAETTTGMDQYAMEKFAEALECVPTIIANNSGFDAVIAVSNIIQLHSKGKKCAGVDVDSTGDGVMDDVTKKGIYDLYIVKKQALDLAFHAAITILSVDQIIMSKPAGGPKPKDNPNWDED